MSLEEAEGEVEVPCEFCGELVWELDALWSQRPYAAFCSDSCYETYFTLINALL